MAAGILAARLPLRGELAALLPPDARSVRDLHAIQSRARVFGTVIVAVQADDPGRRAAAARLVRDRLAALPRDLVLQVDSDNAVRDRYAWDHRYLLAPAADLAGAARRAGATGRRAPTRCTWRWTTTATPRPADARLPTFKQAGGRAAAAAEHPAPLVSPDGRLQLVVARTAFRPTTCRTTRRCWRRRAPPPTRPGRPAPAPA